jgi:serine protease Do
VVIDPAGLVLVNYHTIEGATKVYVHLPGGKGSYADIHAADARSDLAVLKLLSPPDGLVAARLGEVRAYPGDAGPANVFPGKLAALLVNPFVTGFAMDRPSSGLGNLTNVRRRPPGAAREEARDGRTSTVYHYGTFLEYDARLNPGFSGGGLFNLDGELIGLTTAVAAVTGGEAGPGYALPIDGNARRVLAVLRKGEEVEYGFLGIHLGTSVGAGVPIADLTRQGPAEAARLRPGEVVTRVNDNPVVDSNDLFLHVGHALAGSKVKVRVTGGVGQPRDVEVTLGKFQHALPSIASVRPDPVFGLRVDYGSVLVQQIGLDPRVSASGIPPGVAVRELVPGSPAAAKLRGTASDVPRLLITHLNGTPVPNPDAFYRAAKGKRSVKLTVLDPLDPNRPKDITLP